MTDINCKLLCACGVSYAIQKDGSLKDTAPFYKPIGFKAPPKVFQSGTDDINACIVGTCEEGVILSFRGTLGISCQSLQGYIDWFQDFQVETIAVEGLPGKVHKGFWDAVQSLYQDVSAEVLRQMNASDPPMRLYITGHSKGGPLATLFAAQFHLNHQQIELRMATFASPRPGDSDFATWFNQVIPRCIRIEYGNDFVPWAPVSGSLGQYMAGLDVVGPIFRDQLQYNYAPVGWLLFIDWNKKTHEQNSPALEKERISKLEALFGQIDWHVSHDLHILKSIAECHSHECGGGYMSETCTGVCPG